MTLAETCLTVTTMLTGLVAGAELASLIVHDALDRLPVSESRPAGQAVVRRFGKLMPMAMPPTVVVTLATAVVATGVPRLLLILAAVALVVMLAVTFLALAPLNTHELGATPQTPESDWRAWRACWMRWHGIRVGCDIAALGLAASATAVV